MTWLFEESLLVVVLGLISAVILGFCWLQSGRKPLVYAAIFCLVLAVAAAVIEKWVVTDREAVDAVLHQAARDVERNDLAALLSRVHSQAPHIREQAEAEFPRYVFDRVSVKSNLQITLDRPDQATEAVARFNVTVTASTRDRAVEHWHVPRFVTVTFRKEDGQWRVYAYEHEEPGAGARL